MVKIGQKFSFTDSVVFLETKVLERSLKVSV